MSFRSLLRRVGAKSLSVVVAGTISVVGLAGVASATGTLAVTFSGIPATGQTLTASASGGNSPYTLQWYNCTSAVTGGVMTLPPTSCTAITGATSTTYTVQAADASAPGPYITVGVTDSSTPTAGTAAADSAIVTNETVSLTGHASVGQQLTATPGSGTPAYQWYDCTSPVSAGYVASGAPTGCTAIPSETASTYTLAATDYGYYVTVTAILSPATTAAVAASSPLVSEPAPTVASSPTLAVTTSNNNAGTQTNPLTLSNGFSNLYNYTATYQWYDCSSAVTADAATIPAGCYPISTNGTGSQYTFTASDGGQNVSVFVTVTNAAGSAALFATSVGPILTQSPTANTYPSLSAATPTQVTVGSLGTWNGSPPPTSYTVTWYRCAGVGPNAGSSTQTSSCTTVIAGPTTYTSLSPSPMPSYTFTAADENDSVLIGVKANNGVATTYVAYSAASSVFTGSAPSVAVAPTVSGTAAVGSVLTANTGTWSGAPLPTSFQYAWYFCTAQHATGTAQSSATLGSGYSDCTTLQATSGTYTVPVKAPNGTLLAGTYILAVVTASNGISSSSYVTTTTAAVTGPTVPTTGSVSVSVGNNGVATASPTNFNGTPAPTTSSYAYSWYDCSATQAASSAPGSNLASLNLSSSCHLSTTSVNSATHSITASDVANSANGGLISVVEVTTLAGTVWVNSATSTAPLSYSAPTNGSLTVSGTGSLAAPFTATATWTAEPAPTISYQWYMCSSVVSNRTSVSGCGSTSGAIVATGPTFAPTTYNASYPYAVVVATATNYTAAGVQVGTDTQYSSGSLLTPVSLAVTTYPSITVTPTPSSVTTASMLSTSNGVWQGVPAPTFSYQWYACSSVVSSPGVLSSLPNTCASIAGATSSTYVPNGAYVGKYFVAVVTGSNGVSGGNLSVYSASTAAPLVATLSVTSLSISGVASVGTTLTAVSSVYSQSTYTTAYQWYQCTGTNAVSVSVPATCYAIVGATGYTYVPTATQVSYYLTVAETVSGSGATATLVAASTPLVTTSAPSAPTSVTAVAGVGQVTVSWIAPTSGYAVTSYRVLASNGSTCTATTTSCVVTGLLYGTTYTFTVTATNSYGTSPASTVSNAVMPSESYPAAPTAVTAVAGDQSATVSWTAAVSNGALVSQYVVTAYPGGFTCTTSTTSCAVSGLTNGTAYTFTVTARNVVGVGPASLASTAVVPKVNAPSAPINVFVKRANQALAVRWAPGVANGAVVTGYVVSATGGGMTRTCTTSSTSCVVTGLTNGVSYRVTVIAQSSSGNTSTVVPVLVAPAGRPSPPVIYHSARGAGVIIVYFRAPAQTNGAPVAYYQYLINGRWTVQPVKGKLFIVLRGLLRHHAYIVRVRAVSVGGASGASKFVRVITL